MHSQSGFYLKVCLRILCGPIVTAGQIGNVRAEKPVFRGRSTCQTSFCENDVRKSLVLNRHATLPPRKRTPLHRGLLCRKGVPHGRNDIPFWGHMKPATTRWRLIIQQKESRDNLRAVAILHSGRENTVHIPPLPPERPPARRHCEALHVREALQHGAVDRGTRTHIYKHTHIQKNARKGRIEATRTWCYQIMKGSQ